MPFDPAFLREAIALSRARMREGAGGPFGAVVVRGGAVVARGWNRVTSENDPTAHAEVSAIRAACAALSTFSLAGCELYASCEPCPMCLAAIYWARLDALYYAAGRDDAAAAGFDDALLYEELPRFPESRSLRVERHLADEARVALAEWMQKADRIRY